ncbi:MAG: hypothetical protein K5858_10770 [Lachnospiraceae bacterium]|nr:hypothetical protein [Lachnospiraceae bacterium]
MKQIVFIPYSARMWDSFESVYLEAKKNPDLEAFVLPIPYYEKNPDGSIKKVHYDVDDYPDYVAVMDYRYLDLSHFEPDVAVISFPYDGQSKIIGIDSQFYSSNLKTNCDNLVYIPHFIFKNINVFNKDDVKAAMPSCTFPAVFNSNAVAVQSESIREVYIKAIIEESRGRIKRDYLEDRIIATGSPKIDRLTKIASEGAGMPPSWQPFLKTEEKRRKKLLLFNVNPEVFLEDENKALKMIAENFKLFEKYSKYLVPVFRPHPFYRMTIAAERPQLLSVYDGLVNYFKEKELGIFDESADVSKTMVLCDAYLGDRSSLVQMMQVLGKPILVQESVQDPKEIEKYVAKVAASMPGRRTIKKTSYGVSVMNLINRLIEYQ